MFKSMMVPLSNPTVEHAALEAAVRIARASAARLHVVHVRERKNGASHDRESEALLAAASWAGDELDESVSFKSLERPADTSHANGVMQALDEHASANQIDLIVMARRRHSLNRLLFGSVGEHLLLSHDIPILFMPQGNNALPRRGCRILLALDGTIAGEAVLADAIVLARALKGSLTLARVLAPLLRLGDESPGDSYALVEEEGIHGEESAHAYLDSVAERIETAGVETRSYTVASDRVSPALRKAAANERVHVVALAPRTGDGSLHFAMDSVTEALLRKNETALLARRRPTSKS
jgi:nucleotide-binding universal stress UspA family protein